VFLEFLMKTPGDNSAAKDELAQILPLVYAELRRLAHRHMEGERPGHTLQATALVHEAWIKLSSGQFPQAFQRGEFLAAASITMRRILVDHARRKDRLKRGGGTATSRLSPTLIEAGREQVDVTLLDEALERLESAHPRSARVTELRVFGGASMNEIAQALEITTRTAERDWRFARAWL